MSSPHQQAFALNGAERLDKTNDVAFLRTAVKELWNILDNIEMMPEVAPNNATLQRTLTEQELARRTQIGISPNRQGNLMIHRNSDG